MDAHTRPRIEVDLPAFDTLMEEEFGLLSDYAIAKALELEHSTIRRLRLREAEDRPVVGDRFVAQTLDYAKRRRAAAGEAPVKFEHVFRVTS